MAGRPADEEGLVAVDPFSDWGYAFGDVEHGQQAAAAQRHRLADVWQQPGSGFVEIAAYRDGAVVIRSGDLVRADAGEEGEEWLVAGRGLDTIALVRADGDTRAGLPLEEFLRLNPRYLAGQDVAYHGGRWRVDPGGGQLTLRSEERTLRADAGDLVRANLAELRARTVLLVDKG